MREKKEERSVHVRKDDRGITFVELIIAIAVSTIILGAATLFLGTAQKNYNGASAQLDLQSESQILMEQLGMWVMEGNRVDVVDNVCNAAGGLSGATQYRFRRLTERCEPAGRDGIEENFLDAKRK